MRFTLLPYLAVAAVAGVLITLAQRWLGWSDDLALGVSMVVVLVLIAAAGLRRERMELHRHSH